MSESALTGWVHTEGAHNLTRSKRLGLHASMGPDLKLTLLGENGERES